MNRRPAYPTVEVECPECGGEGFTERHDASGMTWGDLETCPECDGMGVIEIEVEDAE